MKTFSDKIDSLVLLGAIFDSAEFEGVALKASDENPWFTPNMIHRAVDAIRCEMLDRQKLVDWLSSYKPSLAKLSVGIVMAGNIPLVGFFDLLVAFVSGNKIIVKPSSKDRALMEYVIRKLVEISGVEIKIVDRITPDEVDFLVAMCSDATAQILKQDYIFSTNIVRGSRHSIAKLTGQESVEQLQELSKDMFLYWGMGCRNITHLLVPKGYSFDELIKNTKAFDSPYYNQKFTYERARFKMQMLEHIEAQDYLLVPMSSDQTPPLSVVGYSYYDQNTSVNPKNLQCTIGFPELECNTDFGKTQYPTLAEVPNGIDLLALLLGEEGVKAQNKL